MLPLPKDKDGNVDTYKAGAPIALGGVLIVVLAVLGFFYLAPDPLGHGDNVAKPGKLMKTQ